MVCRGLTDTSVRRHETAHFQRNGMILQASCHFIVVSVGRWSLNSRYFSQDEDMDNFTHINIYCPKKHRSEARPKTGLLGTKILMHTSKLTAVI